MMNQSRSRWAAIGAAVAVCLGAGGLSIANATSDSGDGAVSAFFPIEPCRIADTRPDPDTVGPRETGIGEKETYDIDGWGEVGDCELPDDTSGLVMNVTAVGATQQTNLRFFPTDADVPTAANLNPSPGAPPTPNAVTVALNDTTGQFSVFNAFGTVAIIIDVVGYYDDHTHDNLYSNGVAYASDTAAANLNPATATELLQMPIAAPVDGHLVVDGLASVSVSNGVSVKCWIGLDSTDEMNSHVIQYHNADLVTEWNDAVGFEVTAGEHIVYLLCQQADGVADDASVEARRLTAVFSANSLAPTTTAATTTTTTTVAP